MKSIAGLFDRSGQAERARTELNHRRLDQSVSSVVVPEGASRRRLASAAFADLEDAVVEKDVGLGIAIGLPLGGLTGLWFAVSALKAPGVASVCLSKTLGVTLTGIIGLTLASRLEMVLIGTMMGAWLGICTGGLLGRVIAALVKRSLPVQNELR